MFEFFQDFARECKLEFQYTFDADFDAHRFIFVNPRTQRRWTYMIHSEELLRKTNNDRNGFMDFIVKGATQLI